MPTYLKSVSQLRNIEWSKQYLWDIRFDDAPSPFNEWFPASEVEEGLYAINYREFAPGFKIPDNTSYLDIKITFYDNISRALEEWMREWASDVSLDNARVNWISESSKTVHIARLDSNRDPIRVNSYQVVPEGAFYFHGTSQSEAETNTITLVIVGSVGSQSS